MSTRPNGGSNRKLLVIGGPQDRVVAPRASYTLPERRLAALRCYRDRVDSLRKYGRSGQVDDRTRVKSGLLKKTERKKASRLPHRGRREASANRCVRQANRGARPIGLARPLLAAP